MLANKYKPTTFADLVFQTDISRKKLEKYATGAASGDILLYGPFGSSKSAAAHVVANQSRQEVSAGFEMDVDVLNGADFESDQLELVERGWQMSGQSFAYAVFDEFDLVHPLQQAKVRALMDRYSGTHGFVFTTNHLHRIDGAIQSRCDIIEMPALSPEALLPLCKRIFSNECMSLTDGQILEAIQHENGDIRSVLRQLERIVMDARKRKAA